MRPKYEYLRGFAAYSELFKIHKHTDRLLPVHFWQCSTLFENGCQPLIYFNVGLQKVNKLTGIYFS